jgi:hypothetical protein
MGSADGPPAGTFSNVATGIDVYAIGVDGSLRFLAPQQPGQSPPPAGKFKQLASPCGLRTDDTVACWGSITAPSGTFSSLAALANYEGYCGLRTDGTLSCLAPTAPAPPAGQYSRIFAGYKSFCAVDLGGQLNCWGDLGPIASAPLSGVFTDGAISWYRGGDGLGVYETICALDTEGKPVCTADLGPDSNDRYTSLSGDLRHMCGLKRDGQLGCFGYVGNGVHLPPGEFVSIDRSCAVRKDGQIACWGEVERPAQY